MSALPPASNPSPREGRARVLGHDVNTDALIASHRKKETLDPQRLRVHLLEDLLPGFAATLEPGDWLVAGRNFGCGSAMEVAVTVVQGAGIGVVVAQGFARTYRRNALNNGLLLVTVDTTSIREGDALRLRWVDGGLWLDVLGTAPHRLICEALPPFVQTLLAAGGLVPYLRTHRRLR